MAENQTTESRDEVELAEDINSMARTCAEETIYRASLFLNNRSKVLRAVITRLENAI